MKLSVSVIIPALNEEKTIAQAIQSVVKICQVALADYEVIVYNDGSTDRTGTIAETLAKKNHRIRVIHNPKNLGLGFIFRDCLRHAKKSRFMFYPGDADMASWSLLELMKNAHRADLVIGYPRRAAARPLGRRIISKTFIALLNFLLGLSFTYYTGPFICKVAPVKRLPLKSHGFTAFFEFKVRLVKSGCTVYEIPFDHVGRTYGGTKVFKITNILDTIRMILLLFRTYRLGWL